MYLSHFQWRRPLGQTKCDFYIKFPSLLASIIMNDRVSNNGEIDITCLTTLPDESNQIVYFENWFLSPNNFNLIATSRVGAYAIALGY